MRLFFYGTLTDLDVLGIVLGRTPDAADCRASVVRGYERVWVADENYPALRDCPNGEVTGLVVSGLSQDDLARICFFEGDEFELRPLPVYPLDADVVSGDALGAAAVGDPVPETASEPDLALTFVSAANVPLTDRHWELETWRSSYKQSFLPMARDWMAGFGIVEIAELEGQWQAALRRARSH